MSNRTEPSQVIVVGPGKIRDTCSVNKSAIKSNAQVAKTTTDLQQILISIGDSEQSYRNSQGAPNNNDPLI